MELGRLDLLMADVDDAGNMVGWLVADLKTGKAPQGELKQEVNRQLRLYRDILQSNNPNGPTIRTEGWYTADTTKWPAYGDNVLEAAYEAWNATQPTKIPLDQTPVSPHVVVFVIGKHGVLIGGTGVSRAIHCTKVIFLTLLS